MIGYDVTGANLENSLYAFGQSEKSLRVQCINTNTWSAYHLNGIFGNSAPNSNGTVHPGGKFSEKKVTPFEVFFSSLLPEFPKISVPFVALTASLPKQKHSRAKSRQLRRLTLTVPGFSR